MKWGGRMKILRLSLFNLKKNRREGIGILFMTMITAMMLSIVFINQKKIDTAFEESFVSSGCVNDAVIFKKDRYRNVFKEILEREYNTERLTEGRMIYACVVDAYTPDDDVVSYNFVFVTEKTERKIESFKKLDHLPDDKIASLKHPIWLPAAFQLVKGYSVGEDFTILKNGKEYPFTIAGFYETGLNSSDGYTYKLILTEEDYSLFAMLYESAAFGEYTGLFFDGGNDFDYDGYLKKCNESASENVSLAALYFSYELEKRNETSFLEIFMLVLIFMSIVTLIAALFMIRHKISGDIEDQMVNIGVLEALGYRSREISLAYLYEYVISGGLGALIGTAAALAMTPFVNSMISVMLGRRVYGTDGIAGGMLAALSVIVFVVLFALLKAGTVKNYPPVIALRKGIKTHHFGRNMLPVERICKDINTGLAIKSFLGNIKASIGICICITACGTALLFAAMSYDFFKDGPDGLLTMMGDDVDSVNVHLISGVDAEEIREKILALPQARKALTGYFQEAVSVQGSSDKATVIIFDDFKDAENVRPYEGRFPEHDNEVMIGLRRSRTENLNLGDSIILEHNGLEKSYIITGIVGTMQNGGTVVYLTTDGYERLNIFARENVVHVYPEEGVSLTELEEAIKKQFGGTAKDAAAAGQKAAGAEERIKAAAEEKIAVLLNQYGVTDVDYAIQIGDEVITGNSRGFLIKEISSYEGLIKTQMVPIAETTKKFTVLALVLIAAIVAVLLTIVSSNDVRRQRQSLGIMKGLGYSSKDLMKQIAIKFLPANVSGIILATACGIFLNKVFWGMAFATIAVTNVTVIILTDILLLLFCYAVTYLSAGRIRKISVTELMTE